MQPKFRLFNLATERHFTEYTSRCALDKSVKCRKKQNHYCIEAITIHELSVSYLNSLSNKHCEGNGYMMSSPEWPEHTFLLQTALYFNTEYFSYGALSSKTKIK